jgi:diphosphomevalonate decarboxylase
MWRVLSKSTACAHTIQGLVKYHGLKNRKLRLPYHDSISVCAKGLTTTATVDFDGRYLEDLIEINGAVATGNEARRVTAVIDPLRKLAKNKHHFKLVSANNLTKVKGVGYSAAAFASIALAASTALNLKSDLSHLSEIARLGSGSASRSLVGGFAIWYANKNGRSFARQLDDGTRVKLAMGIVPLASDVKTELAHEESVSSPFFTARVKEVKTQVSRMLRAIRKGDVNEVCRIAEEDSLSLHAVTMTGRRGLVLMSPETVNVINRVKAMREDKDIPVWYSLDTGPSVFLNTQPGYLDAVVEDIQNRANLQVIKSEVGGAAHTIRHHLF